MTTTAPSLAASEDGLPGQAIAGRSAVAGGPPTLLIAFAVGLIVTNISAAQPLVGPMGTSLAMQAEAAGLIPMATLLGYALGLFLLVPLADLVENRKLALRMLGVAVLAAGGASLAPTAPILIVLLLILGAACSAIQVMVPIAAGMAPPERRGRVIGDVMSGLMVGILLSRPIASLVTDAFGWRAFYGLSAVAMAALAMLLAARLPRIRPAARSGYPALLKSLWQLMRSEPVLRRRALSASLGLGLFSLFWTAVALRLAQAPFDLSQRGIAIFALAGAGGAIATPLFGRAADRGWSRPATIATHMMMVAAMALLAWAGSAGAVPSPTVALALMGAGAILLDIGVIGDQTLGRHAVNLLDPEARARLNALFVGTFFVGGAVGSGLAGVIWALGGWPAVCTAGAVVGICALAIDWLGPQQSPNRIVKETA